MADSDPMTDHVRGRLLRIFGLGFGLAVVIGGTIGSGILRNPSVVAAAFVSPNLLILAWLAGGVLKAWVLVALVATLFLAHGNPAAALAAPPPPLYTWVAAAVALRAIYGAYGGWQAAVYFSEEVHEPERNIARATFAGIALVT